MWISILLAVLKIIPFGDIMKAWFTKHADNNRPDMIDAKKAQIEQNYKDENNREISHALESSDPQERAKAFDYIRQQLS